MSVPEALSRSVSTALVALAALWMAAGPVDASDEELRAATERLLAVQHTLEPLPDTSLTRNVGQIAVIEHDGSNYDARLGDDTLNYEGRTRVGLRFYEDHGDEYDFLVVFTNFEFDTDGATAFHLFGRNEVRGIGKPVTSVVPDVFGSGARLKGWIDMADLAQYRSSPLSLTPGDPGFLETLGVLAHEIGHQWLAEARFLDAGGLVSEDLLGADDRHWSYLLDSDGSLLYGADWVDSGGGVFSAARARERYSALDRYLMGLLAPGEVAPITLLRNPSVDRRQIAVAGETVTATVETILVDQLVAAMGERQPSALHSQKEFRAGFIFLTSPGVDPTLEDLEAVERVRRAFGAHFFALTHGAGWIDTSLAPSAPPVGAATPDLGRALGWLVAQQDLDGSWADSPGTSLRDTAAAVQALGRSGATGPDWQQGRLWLQQAQSEGLDFQARRDATLAALGDFGAETSAPIAALLNRQNADGGFGAGLDLQSDALDTALALRALAALGHPPDAPVRSAVSALGPLASADGGWSAVPGGPTSTVVTAEVLLALLDWSDVPEAGPLRASGLAALLSRQNADGGFGASPSTPFASALALEVLLRAGGPPAVVDPLVAWLQQTQLADGSWGGSPFQTALVLGALSESLGANLVVPADSVVVGPDPAQEGEIVGVVARVRNTGRVEAAPSLARIYDGPPGTSAWIAEASVPALGPGHSAEVTFHVPTVDRPGDRTLYVVADAAEQVTESREDDNATPASLTVIGLLADLVIGPADVAVAPAAPEAGETATVSVTVTNRGERTSSAARLRVSVIQPSAGTSVLPEGAIPPLEPGEAVALPFSWTPTTTGEHTLRVVADSEYEVPESDETNGVAERLVEVVDSAPDGVALAVRDLTLVPAVLTELPQALEAQVLVENAGRTPASTSVRLVDDTMGEVLGTASVDIGAREAALVTLGVTIHTPGSRILEAIVDPDDLLPEDDESDNEGEAVLTDESTLDVHVSAATLSSADVERGETVEVDVAVANRGTLDFEDIPLQLVVDGAEGTSELTRRTVGLQAGETDTVTLWWQAGLEGEALALRVVADPFDLLSERREDNNEIPLVLRVRPAAGANLAVSGDQVALDPDPPVEGAPATLQAVVSNTGQAPSGPYRVAFFLGDPDEGGTLIGETTVADTPPGGASTAEVVWSPVSRRGSLGLFVVADSEYAIDESDEEDNYAFRPFQALGLPDLVLTAGDVVLDPPHPREGETVTIRATVRNLGDQPSVATALEVTEGEPDRTPVGSLPVPALDPGALEVLTFLWTPAAPPGARPLHLQVDPGDLVVEQDEGDNTVRRVVIVQDGDLFLSAPYFSPDGDGVLDDTTLSWRATGAVSVIVRDADETVRRTLVVDGPESASVTWDGRDHRGVLLWDGTYSIDLSSADGQLLARATVALDTNRIPIHQATGPRDTVARNLTCNLPPSVHTLSWTAGEQALLGIVQSESEGYPVGLVRVGLDGAVSYLLQDPWFSGATFAHPVAASPEGRSVLLQHDSELHLLDLATGDREPMGVSGQPVAWSPDGRFFVAGEAVLSRDGSQVGDLGGLGVEGRAWAWSPSSDRLAQGGAVTTREGELLFDLGLLEDVEVGYPEWTIWRWDGQIATSLYTCDDEESFDDQGGFESCRVSYVIDPEAGTGEPVEPPYPENPQWSPDGSRFVASDGAVRLQDGTFVARLLDTWLQVSPRSSAGLYSNYEGSDLPGTVCPMKPSDLFAVTNSANLTAELEVARLPGNSGLVLRGTASDRHLDRFELDYALAGDDEAWHPIGAAHDVPIVNDTLAVWVPPAPGTYVVRLRVTDRAGSSRSRTRTVAWDRVPPLVNFSQSTYFVSPDGNGLKDEVVFRYLVTEPHRLDVRVVGPEPASDGAPAAGEVRRLVLEYSDVGPESFTWDGIDESGRLARDGRYTVFLNDLPFRVEVDTRPPELDLKFENAQAAPHPWGATEDCMSVASLSTRPPLPRRTLLGIVRGNRTWHVVDPNLKEWVLQGGLGRTAGTWAVFVPETGPSGEPRLEAGRPVVRREGGRPVDRRDTIEILNEGLPPGFTFSAEDYAGNRAEVVVPPVAEGAWHLGAESGCNPLMAPLGPAVEDGDEPVVHTLAPENVLMMGAAIARPTAGSPDLRFTFEPRDGGTGWDLPFGPRNLERVQQLPIESFEALGVDPTGTYRGRLVSNGSDGEVASDDFLFTPCEQSIRTGAQQGLVWFLFAGVQIGEPVADVRAHLWLETSAGEPEPLGTHSMTFDEGAGQYLLPVPASCEARVRYRIEATGLSGASYPETDAPKQCFKVEGVVPGSCQFSLAIEQSFLGCDSTPDQIGIDIELYAESPARLEIVGGPEESPVLLHSDDAVPVGILSRGLVTADVTGVPGGHFPVRGRLIPLAPDVEPIEAEDDFEIDRTPPVGEILVPPEGGSVCVADGPQIMSVLAQANDASERLEVSAFAHSARGTQPLPRQCGGAPCHADSSVPTGAPISLDWDATFLDSGEYDLELRTCDRSGNQGSVVRHLFVTREPPVMTVTERTPFTFSPNGDGRLDETTVVVRLAQSATVSARVHAGSPEGPVVRTLFEDRPSTATDVPVVWDGLGDGGVGVPDGTYAIAFTAGDACGGEGSTSTTVEVDTEPPVTALTEPVGGQRVSAAVDVLGQVSDPNLERWDLDVECGADWIPIDSKAREVLPGTFIARWDTSQAPIGECRLRLVAEDQAGNVSPDVFATVTVERGDLVERLAVTPEVFSPNGDARLDTASLEYALARQARVWLEVRGTAEVVRVLEAGALREAGPVTHVWDGLDETSALAPDGEYTLWIRAEDPVVSTVSEEETVFFTLDTTAPLLTVARPEADGVIPAADSVIGTVEDTTLVEYAVSATPFGTFPIELNRGTRERRDGPLAPLGALAEGLHTLTVTASDRGENEARIDVPFVVDSTPPRAVLQAPPADAILLRGEAPVPVTGLVGDEHLEGWTLTFASLEDLASPTTLAQDTTEGNSLSLAAWDVRFVPDGVYALVLTATDRGGLSTESRVFVTLDGSPPSVAIDTPAAGGFVTEPLPVIGSVTDRYLDAWTLEVAPGDAASAYQWAPLASGDDDRLSEALAEWMPLPADGVYTLRLRASDEAGGASSETVTVTVDTTPPATPTGLQAQVQPGEEEGFGLVVVSWQPNTEPDLAHYRVVAERLELEETTTDVRHSDELLEGRYVYLVSAVDEAGNESAPASLEVQVDLTPPTLAFLSPDEDGAVSGALEVQGTAWSADDFAEYRLLVGEGETPTAWTLLQRSTLPVAAGRLGDWLALTEGPHVLALEAEDTRGNESRITRSVTVDTTPPDPPVLLRVDHDPPPGDRLVPVWDPSPSPDVAGYLVYRNGALANGGASLPRDLSGLLVPGPSHPDVSLPDGEHCYTVVAVDAAGNASPPSSEICRSLDNRTPRAVIVQPAEGTRFGHALRVVAETPDLDVISVRFEHRAAGTADWVSFGERLNAPWEMTLDPVAAGLGAGDVALQAVATDGTGNTDPDPPAITVVFGDTTPPPALVGLVALVDGEDVSLTWTASDASDFVEYRVYRDGARIAEGLTTPDHVDAGLEIETYGYAVTAVDADGNESSPSDTAQAVVYAPALDVPSWPLVETPAVMVAGDGSRTGTTVKVMSGPVSLGEVPGTGGAFAVPVSLAPDGNRLHARGEDAAGNRSLPSNGIVLISNAPPGGVSGLDASVSGDDVTLQWSPVSDADLFGYRVDRGGMPLTQTVSQDQASTLHATVEPGDAPLAFDQNPATAWPAAPAAGEWRIELPSAVLVERIRLRFASPPEGYSVSADWLGEALPVIRATGNTAPLVEHVLPSPFATQSLTVTLETPGRLAEIEIDRLDVVPAGQTTLLDESVPDGRHTYRVAALDRYGAPGPEATFEADVGDAEAPAAPTGLVAAPDGRDVDLTWNPSPEPDVEHYVVARDGADIGTSPSAEYRDPDLPNGTYTYTVRAVDTAGNESDESLPAEATIDVAPQPPGAPVILEPTDAARPIAVSTTRTDVAGRAEAGSLVTLEVDGQTRGSTLSLPGFEAAPAVLLAQASSRALSPDGAQLAYVETSGVVAVRDLATGAVELYDDGADRPSEDLVFSPDGAAIAFTRRVFVSGQGYLPEVVRLRLVDRSVAVVLEGSPADYAWSPDGSTLAVSLHEADGTSLHLVEVETGNQTPLLSSPGTDAHLRWSPDGVHLAFVRAWSPTVVELRLLALSSGDEDVVDAQAWPGASPSWSSDGRLLAWTSAATDQRHVRVRDTATSEEVDGIAAPGIHVQNPRFSPTGDWLSVVRVTPDAGSGGQHQVTASHRTQSLTVVVHRLAPGAEVDSHDWTRGGLSVVSGDWLRRFTPVDGRFALSDVALHPGENRLVARATDPVADLESPDSAAVLVTAPDASFPNLRVEPASVSAVPPVPLAAVDAELRIVVANVGDTNAETTDVRVTVLDPEGGLVDDWVATLAAVSPGESEEVRVPWTPQAAGRHQVLVQVDPEARVAESLETDNATQREIVVAGDETLAAVIDSDRDRYGPDDTATVSVGLANPGPSFVGAARTVVEDAAGGEVAILDERAVALEYGQRADWTLTWPTGTTWAGSYRFRVAATATGEEAERASAVRTFTLEPSEQLAVAVQAAPALVPAGAPVSFALEVRNVGPNAPLETATARLRVVPVGGGPALFETTRALPTLLPGATWTGNETWPAASPDGVHTVELDVEGVGGQVLATATAAVNVTPGAPAVTGALVVDPGHVMTGEPAEARVALSNGGTLGVVGHPISVDVVSGPEATVHASAAAVVDLPAGTVQDLTLGLDTTGLAPGPYVVLLRAGAPATSLSRDGLILHGPLAPPSPHAPADGGTVGTSHPVLEVNNATSAEGAARTYAFEVFGDAALTQPLPGITGVAETPDRTGWRVAANLSEDVTYWWRARATDGFSTSPWSAVASFTVDAVNLPPHAPVPDTPGPDARVASRQPTLTVRNAFDPEGAALQYEFQLGTTEAMDDVVTSVTGVAEGLGLTSWTVPVVLDENAILYWAARASDGENLSPWTVPVRFRVDSVNESPTAPLPVRPVDGEDVATLMPTLAVENGEDPEDDPVTYRFELDSVPTFDSPDRQASPVVAEGPLETEWTPPIALVENTSYYWRAFASDGTTETPSVVAGFFVNVTNEAPTAPVAIDPVDGRAVGTATPTLRLRNAQDPEDDALSYEVVVRDAAGALVAESPLVPEGTDETTWLVSVSLTENERFTWSVRATDGDLYGPWSDAAGFRVNAVDEPPTAPTPLEPANGAVLEERRPALVVANATSPDGLDLVYTFELSVVTSSGSTLFESAVGVPEGVDTTSWAPSVDLPDDEYEWRARASDPGQDGAWSATFRFEVRVDPPPAPPLGLGATPGDQSVRLDWDASLEPDVTGYRVYRSLTSGGPYDPIASVATPGYDDTGLTNGVTYYYVVTAVDARSESLPSLEAAARPEAPGALVMEVRYDPSSLSGECLLSRGHGHRARWPGRRSPHRWSHRNLDEELARHGHAYRGHHDDRRRWSRRPWRWPHHRTPECPRWIMATLELPSGHDPGSIDLDSLRFLGQVPVDPSFDGLVDVDHDGIVERRVRFRLASAAPHLAVGDNTVTVTGTAGSYELEGQATIHVAPLETDLVILPRVLRRHCWGRHVLAIVTFAHGVDTRDLDASSVRLNDVVPAKRIVWAFGRKALVKFDRAEVIRVLPPGPSVEVRITGTLRGLPFEGIDHVRVKP